MDKTNIIHAISGCCHKKSTNENDLRNEHKNSITKIMESAKNIATILYKGKDNKMKSCNKELNKLNWFEAVKKNSSKLSKTTTLEICHTTKGIDCNHTTQKIVNRFFPVYNIEAVIMLTESLSAFCNREGNNIDELIKTNKENPTSILTEYVNISYGVLKIWVNVDQDQKKYIAESSLKLFLLNSNFKNFCQKTEDISAINNYLKILLNVNECCIIDYATEQQKVELLNILKWDSIKKSILSDEECLASYMKLLAFAANASFFEGEQLFVFKSQKSKEEYQKFWMSNLRQFLDNEKLYSLILSKNNADNIGILERFLSELSNIAYMIDLFDIEFRDNLTGMLIELASNLLSNDCITNVFQNGIQDLSKYLVMMIINILRCQNLFSEEEQIEIMKFCKMLLKHDCFRSVLFENPRLLWAYLENLGIQLDPQNINKEIADILFVDALDILKKFIDNKSDFRKHILSSETVVSNKSDGKTHSIIEKFKCILNHMSSLTIFQRVSEQNTKDLISFFKEIIKRQDDSDIKNMIINTDGFSFMMVWHYNLSSSLLKESNLFTICITKINKFTHDLKKDIHCGLFAFGVLLLEKIINAKNIFENCAFNTKNENHRNEIDTFTEILKNISHLATQNLDSKNKELLWDKYRTRFIDIIISILRDEEKNSDIKAMILNNRNKNNGTHQSILNLLFVFGSLLSKDNLPKLDNQTRNKLIDSFFSLRKYRKIIFTSQDFKPVGTISFYINTLHKLLQFYETEQEKTSKRNIHDTKKFLCQINPINELDEWTADIEEFIDYLKETPSMDKQGNLLEKLDSHVRTKIAFMEDFISENKSKIRTPNVIANIFGATKKTRNLQSKSNGLKLNLSAVFKIKNKVISDFNIRTIRNKSDLKSTQQSRSMSDIFDGQSKKAGNSKLKGLNLKIFDSSNKSTQSKAKNIDPINFYTSKLKLNINQGKIMPNVENKIKFNLGDYFYKK